MKKSLMAVAVAGALATPVIVAAQSSVTISGRATVEYGRLDAGFNRPSTDYSDTPGGSALRVAGVENLGGGLSAWFQCETSMDIRGFDKVGLCSRNSAVGLRGPFGNIFHGKWDTPFKNALNRGTVGAEETGILGTSFLGFGGSGGAQAAARANNGASTSDTFGDHMQRQRFKRRESGITMYQTPNFGGFQVEGAFTTGNAAADSELVNADTNKKPRVYSIGAQYSAGPLQIGVGYEKHKDFGIGVATIATAFGNVEIPSAAATDLDDKGWGVGVSYGFMRGNLLVGFTWLRREWETGVGAETKKDTWQIGLDWRLPGPHQIQVQYGKARDTRGNGGNIGANGGVTGCGAAQNCADTGADQWSVAYQYHFSKRTTIKFGYTRVDNDARTNTNRIGNSAPLDSGQLGQNVDGYALLVKHNF